MSDAKTKNYDAVMIDKGVPVPTHKNAHWPFEKMGIGDSFLAPGHVVSMTQRTKSKEPIMNISAFRLTVRFPGTKWTARGVKEDGITGVRVWRVA